MKHYPVKLTNDELLLLDGKCEGETQLQVEQAKERARLQSAHGLSEPFSALVAEVLNEARTQGKLQYRPTHVDFCATCSQHAGYALYTRSGQDHQKGEPNYSKPLSMPAVEFAVRFVTIKRSVYVGACTPCVDAVLPVLQKELATVRAEIPESLLGRDNGLRHGKIYTCSVCGWEGNELTMRKLRTALNDGWYHGGCPNCPTENQFGILRITPVKPERWSLVEVPP